MRIVRELTVMFFARDKSLKLRRMGPLSSSCESYLSNGAKSSNLSPPKRGRCGRKVLAHTERPLEFPTD